MTHLPPLAGLVAAVNTRRRDRSKSNGSSTAEEEEEAILAVVHFLKWVVEISYIGGLDRSSKDGCSKQFVSRNWNGC